MSDAVDWFDNNVWKPTKNAIEDNPVAVLVDVGLMAMGVPPVYAAAAGAGTNTAVKGGSAADILKSAVVGGATAYVGGAASQYVGNAGFGQGLSGAAGGAAAGATGAALTGGNIWQGALTGGAVGGTIGSGMQYFAGSGAVNPAAAGSQMSRADYAASVPDNVLADALKTQDPYGYVQKQMGWNGQGTSAGATWDALNDYQAASTPAVQPSTTVTAPVQPTVNIDTALAAANAPGVIDPLGTLIEQMNWSPASTAGVTASVAEAYGQKTAQQLAKERAAQLTPQQQTNVNARVPGLLNEATNNANIDTIMSKSTDTSSVIKNLGWSDNQFTREAAQQLLDSYKAENTVTNNLSNQQADYIKAHQVTPPPVTPVAPVEPTIQPATNPNGGLDLGPASQTTSQLTPAQISQQLNNPTTTPIAPVQPVQPVNTVDVGGGNYMDQQGNIVDVNGNVTNPAVVPGPAQPYTAQADIPFKVDMGGPAGSKETPSVVIKEYRTPNTDLATLDEINNGTAKWNPDANAWETPSSQPIKTSGGTDINNVPGQATSPVITQQTIPGQPFLMYMSTNMDQSGQSVTTNHYSDGTITTTTPNVPTTQPVNTGSGSAVVTPQVPTVPSNMNQQPYVQQPYVDPNVNAVVTPPTSSQPSNQQVANVNITGTPTVIAQPPTETNASNSTIVPVIPPTVPSTGSSIGTSGNVVVTPQVPIDTSSTITQGTTQTQPPLVPLVPTPITTTPPVTNVDVSAGGTDTTDNVIHNPAPVVVVPPTTPPTTPTSSTHYGTYNWGTPVKLNLPTGLNPGWIQPTDFYNTTSPVQSHYYWGGHPYQAGPTFNPTTYNAVPNAPGTPWGLQQSFNPNYVYPVAP